MKRQRIRSNGGGGGDVAIDFSVAIQSSQQQYREYELTCLTKDKTQDVKEYHFTFPYEHSSKNDPLLSPKLLRDSGGGGSGSQETSTDRVNVRIIDRETKVYIAGFDLDFPTVYNDRLIPDSIYESDYTSLRVLPTCTLDFSIPHEVKVYFMMENNEDGWEIGVSCDYWMFRYFPDTYCALPFYHPDPQYKETKEVPIHQRRQRAYHWFNHRTGGGGRVGGSTSTKYVGYFKNNSGGPPDAKGRERMKYGRIHEIDAVICYLSAYDPDRIIYECGWYDISPGGAFGASPDGIIVDGRKTWDAIPGWLLKCYASGGERDKAVLQQIDCKRGVLEIKVSQSNANMEGYYIPQLYMEMVATNTLWCDLVKLCPQKGECYVYRLYRVPEMERELQGLLQITKNKLNHGQPTHIAVDTPENKAFRDKCDKKARYYNLNRKAIPVKQELMNAFHDWRASLQRKPRLENLIRVRMPQLRSLWSNIVEISTEIEAILFTTTPNNGTAMDEIIKEKLCEQQVTNYVNLMKLLLLRNN